MGISKFLVSLSLQVISFSQALMQDRKCEAGIYPGQVASLRKIFLLMFLFDDELAYMHITF